MTIEKLKEQIRFACYMTDIELDKIRKAKKSNGVYVYAKNGKTAYVGINDDYYTIGRMYTTLGYRKPKIVRIV